jgi:hypothetical protein
VINYWNSLSVKKVKIHASDAVLKGLLGEGEAVEVNHAMAKTYYRL